MDSRKIQEARELLRRHWGHDSFRPGQQEAIETILSGRDVLLVMATGGGKSLCYQLPALVLPGVVLVISPLIALMEDQVDALTKRGISATLLHSGLATRTINKRFSEVEAGQHRLFYVAPERLRARGFQDWLLRQSISLLAVDEAHCVSVWGHDFRPSYRTIPEVYEHLGRPPIIATTGTATQRVQQDVASGLGLRNPVSWIGTLDRPNLRFSVHWDADKEETLQAILEENPGSGIIYAGTRRNVSMWANRLRREGETVVEYHAGLRARERASARKKWMNKKARVVVATNAFGMGIDRPDVRFVVHLEPPYSLEAYYQEAGRAGRDGKPAVAVLFYAKQDIPQQDVVVRRRHPLPEDVFLVYDVICSEGQVAVGSRPRAPIPVDLARTARATGLSPAAVERIVYLIAEHGTWTARSGTLGSGMVRMWESANAMRRFTRELQNDARRKFALRLLRSVNANAYYDWVPVDLSGLAGELKLSQAQLAAEMGFLAERGMLSWRTLEGDVRVRFRRERAELLSIDYDALMHNRQRALDSIWDMRQYVQAKQCRMRLLRSFFGETRSKECVHCDECVHRCPTA